MMMADRKSEEKSSSPKSSWVYTIMAEGGRATIEVVSYAFLWVGLGETGAFRLVYSSKTHPNYSSHTTE